MISKYISVLSAAFHCFVTQFQHSNDNLDEGPPLRRSFGPWHRRWSNNIGKDFNSCVQGERSVPARVACLGPRGQNRWGTATLRTFEVVSAQRWSHHDHTAEEASELLALSGWWLLEENLVTLYQSLSIKHYKYICNALIMLVMHLTMNCMI